jgi:hypothetical protein
MGINVGNRVGDGLNRTGIFIIDIELKLFTKAINEEELIHGICFQVFNKPGIIFDFGWIYL